MRALAFAAVLVTGASAAHADDPARAASLFDSGMKHYNVGEYREALQAFKDGYFAKADPTFLFNMGQCYRMLGEPEGAARQYRAYLRSQPDAPNRREVEKFIGDAEDELRRKAAARPPTGVEPPKDTPRTEAPPPEAPPPATPDPIVTASTEAPPLYKRAVLWVAVGAVLVVAAAVAVVIAVVPSDAGAPSTELGATAIHF